MVDVPPDLLERCHAYCDERGLELEAIRGWGFDGFVWQTRQDSMLKVFRSGTAFQTELRVYRRLESHGIEKLQGFRVPILLHYDTPRWVLELSFVRPPYVLDFAGASLDERPPDFDPESQEWIDEKRRVYGEHWPRVSRLLDALRHLGIHYWDVHRENIRVEP